MTRVRALVTAYDFCDNADPYLHIRVLRGGHDNIHEDLQCLLEMSPEIVVSGSNRRLPPGSKVTVLITADVHYTQSWEGEHDMDLGDVTIGRKTVQVPTRRQQKKDAFHFAQRDARLAART